LTSASRSFIARRPWQKKHVSHPFNRACFSRHSTCVGSTLLPRRNLLDRAISPQCLKRPPAPLKIVGELSFSFVPSLVSLARFGIYLSISCPVFWDQLRPRFWRLPRTGNFRNSLSNHFIRPSCYQHWRERAISTASMSADVQRPALRTEIQLRVILAGSVSRSPGLIA